MSIIIISQLHIYFWFREIPSFFYNGCTSPQHSVKDVLIFCTGRYYVDVPNAKFYTLIDSTFFSRLPMRTLYQNRFYIFLSHKCTEIDHLFSHLSISFIGHSNFLFSHSCTRIQPHILFLIRTFFSYQASQVRKR